jgi:hypothetical protein
LQLPHGWKARVVPFREGNRVFMQDVGNMEDMELNSEDLSLRSRGLLVEFLGHCQSVGNWMFFPEGKVVRER